MMHTFRIAAAVCSAVILTSALPPVPAHAAESYKAVFHLEEAGGSAPLVLNVSDEDWVSSAVRNAAFNRNGNALIYPEPVGGKAVGGWTDRPDGTSPVSLDFTPDENLEFYPLMIDTVSPGTVSLTFDTSILTAGAALPDKSEVTAHTSVPDDAPYTLVSAGFNPNIGTPTVENDRFYYYSAVLQPKEGTVFDYTYAADNRRVYNIDGASVNGEHAAVQWDDDLLDERRITVNFPVKLGNPETVNLTLHYNNGTPDQTVEVAKGSNDAYQFLDDAAGQRIPQNGEQIFDGWYRSSDLSGTGVIPSYLTNFWFDEDADLYAGWSDVITEVNLTIETPLCGQVVEYEDDRFNVTSTETVLSDIADGPDGEAIAGDDPAPVSEVIRNEPQITCDVPSLEIDAFWIISDVAPANMTGDTQVEYFLDQMIQGENEYLFAISGKRKEESRAPYFSKDLKITVNGIVAAEGAAAVQTMQSLSKPGVTGSKAGKVTQVNTVQKNGSNFVVVGIITADHDWDDGVVKVPADCDKTGEKLYTCRIKDASYSEEIDAFGHHWEEWVVVKAATQTEDGLEQRVCDNNGEHKETRTIPKGTRLNDKPAAAADAPKTGDTGAGILLSCGAAAALLAVLSAGCRRKKTKI